MSNTNDLRILNDTNARCESKIMYIVTGAYGHLGNTLVNKLAQTRPNCLIRGFVLENDFSIEFQYKNVEIYRGDIRIKESIEPIFRSTIGYDSVIVIHTAGIVSISSKFKPIVREVNVDGTKNIVELCQKYNVKKLVHVSSVHAIPDSKDGRIIKETGSFSPDNVYGFYAKTKAEASQVVMDSVHHGLDAAIVHPSGIIGAGDYGRGHITQLIIDYLNGGLVAAVKGGYDFVDVRDVADGIISCTQNSKAGDCYILSNKYFTIKQLLDIVHEITHHKKISVILPQWLARAAAPMSELYYRLKKQPPLYTSYSLYSLRGHTCFSHERATEALGYNPRDIEDTLSDTVQWLKSHHRIKC